MFNVLLQFSEFCADAQMHSLSMSYPAAGMQSMSCTDAWPSSLHPCKLHNTRHGTCSQLKPQAALHSPLHVV